MRKIRIFVSSPDDAAHERGRVERVVERLNGAFGNRVRLTAVRWETGFYAAHATFQAQIPEAAACDVVIAIFRSRLGTRLPPDFPSMPDGEPYPSGTAYEVLSAIEARKVKRRPDVFVFRYRFPPSVTLDDPENETAVREQWIRLKQFFERWFMTPEGQFKAAFQPYNDFDRFEEQVEALLRGWLEEHVLGAGTLTWPIGVKGSPFRGLEAFGAKHAAVFFGRERDIERTVDVLKDAASNKDRLPFLLLIGPSGAGKSSLARAGIVPRLTTSGVAPEVDVWRTVVMRPMEVPGGPFSSLATRLFDDATDIPDAESERPKALPELRDGDHVDPGELANLLRHADEAAIKPILKALDRVAAHEGTSRGGTRAVQVRLLLVVDQIDELLGGDVDDRERECFGRLLGLLAATRRVWIVATLRADLYELYSADAGLLALKKRGAAYDVEPPRAAALEEIVRQPATAAGLGFDERILPNGQRQRLDERLIADAERPDMLPLLQFTLNSLFEARETREAVQLLTHAAYDRLGGLDGAIAREAERALAGLHEVEQIRMPRLIRQLLTSVESQAAAGTRTARVAIRSVAYAEAAYDDTSKALVDALIAARILLAEAGGGSASGQQVRLAHQRVLEAWPRARAIMEENAFFFRVRPEVEHDKARWLENGKPADLLLARGVALSEAEKLTRMFGEEISPSTLAYVQASTRRARRAQRLTTAAAAVFAAIAIGAGTAGFIAYRAEQRAAAARDEAQRNFAVAKQTIDAAIFQFVGAFKDTDGIKGAVLQRVLTSTRQGLDRLAGVARDDQQLQHSRLSMLHEFGDLLERAGERSTALATYEESLAIARALAQRDPANDLWQRDVAVSLYRIGNSRSAAGERAGALAAYDESLAITRTSLNRNPNNAYLLRDASTILLAIGDLRLEAGDRTPALTAFTESLAIARLVVQRDPGDAERWQSQMSISLARIGNLREARGDRVGALAAHEESLAILRTLARADPDNTRWQSDISTTTSKIGDLRKAKGDRAGALSAFEESLTIRRALVGRDPDNTPWKRSLSISLDEIGDLHSEMGERARALAAYEESLTIRRTLAQRDPDNVKWQHDILASLTRIGDQRLAADDRVGALADYDESLAIARKLAQRDPDNTEWQRDMSGSLARIGRLRRAAGDWAAALAAFEKSLAIDRALAQRDPVNPLWQYNVSGSLMQIGDVQKSAGRLAAAQVAYEESLGIGRALTKRDRENTDWQRNVSLTLSRMGALRQMTGDRGEALKAYQEALAIARALVQRDPDSIEWQRDVGVALFRIGGIKEAMGDRAGALAAHEEVLTIAQRLSGRDPATGQRQSDVLVSLEVVGGLRADAGDLAGALAAYEQLLSTLRTLVQRYPDDETWQRNVSVSLGLIGDLKRTMGDRTGAEAAYEESLAIRSAAVRHHPSSVADLIALAQLRGKRGDIFREAGQVVPAADDYEAALGIGLKLAASALDAQQKARVGEILGNVSFGLLFVSRDQQALQAADTALVLAPNKRYLRQNRAIALMLLDRTEEARAAFFDPADRMKPIFDRAPPVWEDAVRNDFKELREAGRSHPLMDLILAGFSESHPQ